MSALLWMSVLVVMLLVLLESKSACSWVSWCQLMSLCQVIGLDILQLIGQSNTTQEEVLESLV